MRNSVIKNTAFNLLVVSILGSCVNQDKNGNDHIASTSNDTIINIKSIPVNPTPDNDSMFYRKPEKGVPVSIKGKLKGVGMPVKIFLDIADGDSLHDELEAEEADAVIRINQIILPDKTADGPFGRTLEYKIRQHGMYTLILGNNLMAEGSTKTAFTLRINVF